MIAVKINMKMLDLQLEFIMGAFVREQAVLFVPKAQYEWAYNVMQDRGYKHGLLKSEQYDKSKYHKTITIGNSPKSDIVYGSDKWLKLCYDYIVFNHYIVYREKRVKKFTLAFVYTKDTTKKQKALCEALKPLVYKYALNVRERGYRDFLDCLHMIQSARFNLTFVKDGIIPWEVILLSLYADCVPLIVGKDIPGLELCSLPRSNSELKEYLEKYNYNIQTRYKLIRDVVKDIDTRCIHIQY